MADTKKRKYVKPRLTPYGDLRALTKGAMRGMAEVGGGPKTRMTGVMP